MFLTPKTIRTLESSGKSTVDRKKNGSKSHLITYANGIPLAITVTSGNLHDFRETGNVLKTRIQGKTRKKTKINCGQWILWGNFAKFKLKNIVSHL